MPTFPNLASFIASVTAKLTKPRRGIGGSEGVRASDVLTALIDAGTYMSELIGGAPVNPTTGRLPKKNGAGGFDDSLISETGGVATVNGNFNVTGVINGIQMSKDMGNAFGATTYLKIAKLREFESSANYDNIIVDLVITRLWAADHLLISRYILANRGSTSATHKYKWYITGGKGPLADNIVAGILCVKNTTTGEVDIYIKVSPTYNLVRFNVVSANNITFYPSEATTTTAPSGTVEFDSTQFNTYPPMFYVDNSGNMKLRGTLTQSVTTW
ncbi:hypothetical protein P1X15_07265 [Runella sp. MFBS21]|uniref:hypothetical protein n=1 Tax=Runella sp. MFBS21 TaxID=3034018 RepID=UPI0023F892FB|nr:hypothetical protein [Runella sp. MFBS21]MDF7817386.1 hypothetical protein [Runella sp. MFBS21]